MKHLINIVICYDGSPLVIARCSEFMTGTDLLDWYAKHYAFERAKLTYSGPLYTIEGPSSYKDIVYWKDGK